MNDWLSRQELNMLNEPTLSSDVKCDLCYEKIAVLRDQHGVDKCRGCLDGSEYEVVKSEPIDHVGGRIELIKKLNSYEVIIFNPNTTYEYDSLMATTQYDIAIKAYDHVLEHAADVFETSASLCPDGISGWATLRHDG